MFLEGSRKVLGRFSEGYRKVLGRFSEGSRKVLGRFRGKGTSTACKKVGGTLQFKKKGLKERSHKTI
jgi:hypothetical protein